MKAFTFIHFLDKYKIKVGSGTEEDGVMLKRWRVLIPLGITSRSSNVPGLTWKGPITLVLFQVKKIKIKILLEFLCPVLMEKVFHLPARVINFVTLFVVLRVNLTNPISV